MRSQPVMVNVETHNGNKPNKYPTTTFIYLQVIPLKSNDA